MSAYVIPESFVIGRKPSAILAQAHALLLDKNFEVRIPLCQETVAALHMLFEARSEPGDLHHPDFYVAGAPSGYTCNDGWMGYVSRSYRYVCLMPAATRHMDRIIATVRALEDEGGEP